MVIYKEKTVQRGYNFAIVDEVDSILIDEARTPLIISGPGSASDEMYGRADAFVRSLRALKIKEKDTKSDYEDVSEDYIVDEKAKRATLTHNGIAKAERFFGVENYADIENTDLTHYVNQALHAHGCMKLDVDYVVMDGKVLIVDSFTGRIMPGRRFSDGLHQAIEAKERVKIENENQTQATITFQNYFRLYGKLSGMTGTALTEEEEFRSIYSLDVVEIPTNRPMIRLDRNDVVYKNEKGKYEAIIEQIRACHEKGQPVLVGTVSVDKSELLSKLLSRVGIKHNVLNAKYHEKEAEIIAQAGKYGAVTISTNMAGRGTDIMLGGNAEFLAKNELRKNGYNEEEILLATGSSEDIIEHVRAARELFREKLEYFKAQIAPEAEEVRKAGGLFILGTERHESRRIDNQLRGRAGRQGDPGESRFYLSLEDDLLRLFGSERIQGLVERLGLPDDQPIDAKILSGTIENAQSQLEMNNFNRRKNVLDYDDVMNQHRNVIYGERRRVLDGEDISETIEKMIHGTITDAVSESIDMESGKLSIDDLRKNIFWLVSKEDFAAEKEYDAEEVTKALTERADAVYQHQKEAFGENIRELERVALLRSVDVHWMEHLDAMDDLRGGVGLAAYAQRNPLNEYRIAAGEMFDAMISNIRVDTVRMILFSCPVEQIKRTQVAKQRSENAAAVGSEQTKKRPVVKAEKQKVGRNDPCPCGSGKKYKKCCGASDTQAD
jgi:preprotein translocase subunit SecA